MGFNPLFSFSAAKDEVRRRLGNRSDFETRLDRWIDSAQSMLAHTSLDMPALDEIIDTFRLTEDVAEYDLSSTDPPLTDIVGFRAFYDTSTGYRLRRMRYADWRSLNSQATSDPFRWARQGYRLVFDPIPETSREIRVEYRREPLSGAIEIENQWQEALLKLATALGWSALDEPAKERALVSTLPATIQIAYNKALSQDQWEAIWDDDLRFGPPR